MKNKLLVIMSSLALAASANATVTLTLSNPAIGVLNSLAPSTSATATNGLLWGIIVDADGDGFEQASYEGGWSVASTLTGFAIPGSSGDLFFLAASNNKTVTAVGGQGGAGSVVAFNGMNISADASGNPAVNTADKFAVIWFDTGIDAGSSIVNNTTKFGFYANNNFALPANGANQSYASNFSAAGPESVRQANLTFVGVPETSTSLLGALGALALLRRRRN